MAGDDDPSRRSGVAKPGPGAETPPRALYPSRRSGVAKPGRLASPSPPRPHPSRRSGVAKPGLRDRESLGGRILAEEAAWPNPDNKTLLMSLHHDWQPPIVRHRVQRVEHHPRVSRRIPSARYNLIQGRSVPRFRRTQIERYPRHFATARVDSFLDVPPVQRKGQPLVLRPAFRVRCQGMPSVCLPASPRIFPPALRHIGIRQPLFRVCVLAVFADVSVTIFVVLSERVYRLQLSAFPTLPFRALPRSRPARRRQAPGGRLRRGAGMPGRGGGHHPVPCVARPG